MLLTLSRVFICRVFIIHPHTTFSVLPWTYNQNLFVFSSLVIHFPFYLSNLCEEKKESEGYYHTHFQFLVFQTASCSCFYPLHLLQLSLKQTWPRLIAVRQSEIFYLQPLQLFHVKAIPSWGFHPQKQSF